MSKKLLAVIALVVASMFVFTACGGDEYAFDALQNNPAATDAVESNGGSYVQKGEYSYFINGAEDGTDKNTFGTYHKGSIVRVKTSDLTKKERVVETVVPKIIYAEDVDSSGFYIFGDKIYYTTPNTSKTTQGIVQIEKLDFMMANIDGTGTKLIATIDDNTKAYRFVEKAGTVYILYVGAEDITLNDQKTSTTALFEINCATKAQKTIANNVDTVVFDSYADSVSVAYTQKIVSADGIDGKEAIEQNCNNLYQYTAGSEKSVEIAKGLDLDAKTSVKYTPVALVENVVYYNAEGKGLVAQSKTFNKFDGSVSKIANNVYTNVMVGANDVIYTVADNYIVKITFGTTPVQTRVCAVSEDVKFEYLTNDYLYYSLPEGYTLHRVDISEDKLASSQMAIAGQMKTTLWASYDFATINGKVCAIYFNDADEINYINYAYICWFDSADNAELTAKRIGLLSANEQKYAFENELEDTQYAVEDFLTAQN